MLLAWLAGSGHKGWGWPYGPYASRAVVVHLTYLVVTWGAGTEPSLCFALSAPATSRRHESNAFEDYPCYPWADGASSRQNQQPRWEKATEEGPWGNKGFKGLPSAFARQTLTRAQKRTDNTETCTTPWAPRWKLEGSCRQPGWALKEQPKTNLQSVGGDLFGAGCLRKSLSLAHHWNGGTEILSITHDKEYTLSEKSF